ncbi:MAG TPA: hypothetical protein VFI84_01740 [Candidatus Saccharimonadales bacterium]|nr:hypothetical protein [Candidatus Saccharimonadales bacterium]
MAAELITPVDESLGIPLPILPNELLPADDPEFANWHHPWHPSSAPALQTLGGKALRHSRVQLVRATDHNMGDRKRGKLTYHDYFIGPQIPTDETEQFKAIIAACAGYTPETAIDLRGTEPRIVAMTSDQRALLRTTASPLTLSTQEMISLKKRAAKAYKLQINPTLSRKQYIDQTVEEVRGREERQRGFNFHHMTYRYEPVRDFLRDYVMRQSLSHIKGNRIDEFLHEQDNDKKARVGVWLLSLAVGKAAHDAQPLYRQLKQEERLHPSMPPDARDLLWFKLGNPLLHAQLLPAFEVRLREQNAA